MPRRSETAHRAPAASATGACKTVPRPRTPRPSPSSSHGAGKARAAGAPIAALRQEEPFMNDKKQEVRQDEGTRKEVIRFAAVGDLHCTEASGGTLRHFFAQATEAADALLLCGDLTDYGTVKEAKVLADELSVVSVPVIAVLGNHDYESGVPDEVRRTLQGAGVHVLDGEAVEVLGIGIAGAKGFAGGFGRASLGSWGEPAIKQFVNEALHEAMKLESALAKLRTHHRIAMLHYAPITGTVQGEPPEIFAFLGSSRLEDP